MQWKPVRVKIWKRRWVYQLIVVGARYAFASKNTGNVESNWHKIWCNWAQQSKGARRNFSAVEVERDGRVLQLTTILRSNALSGGVMGSAEGCISVGGPVESVALHWPWLVDCPTLSFKFGFLCLDTMEGQSYGMWAEIAPILLGTFIGFDSAQTLQGMWNAVDIFMNYKITNKVIFHPKSEKMKIK